MTNMTEPGDASGYAVRLTARLPKAAANGLAAWANALATDPRRVRVAVIAFDTARVIDDIDTGTDTAVVRILRVEPLTDSAAKSAQKLLLAASTKRTGETLPGMDEFEAWATDGTDPDDD